MKVSFFKTGELDGSSYGKIRLRSSAIGKIEIDDKCCFFGSILAKLHPCENNDPNRVSIYRQYFDELNIEGFDFSNGPKCSDVQNIERLNKLSINIFDLVFNQVQSKLKQKTIPLEITKNNSNRVAKKN